MSKKTNIGKLRAAIKKLGPDAQFTVKDFHEISSISQSLGKLEGFYGEIVCIGKIGACKLYKAKTEDARISPWKQVWPEMFVLPDLNNARVVKLEDRRLGVN